MMQKAAIITGASSPIGTGIALTLAVQGYDIVLHTHQHTQKTELLADKIENNTSQKTAVIQADFADPNAAKKLMSAAFERFPHCNTLIHNAAIFEQASFLDTDEALYDRLMHINLRTPFFLTQAFARQCQKGNVITLLDSYITKQHFSHFAYLMTKKSLHDFTKMAAYELAPGIRVNGIAPGITEHNLLPEDFLSRKKSQLPLHSLVESQEIVRALCYLLHDSSQTGSVLFVDSGEHLL